MTTINKISPTLDNCMTRDKNSVVIHDFIDCSRLIQVRLGNFEEDICLDTKGKISWYDQGEEVEVTLDYDSIKNHFASWDKVQELKDAYVDALPENASKREIGWAKKQAFTAVFRVAKIVAHEIFERMDLEVSQAVYREFGKTGISISEYNRALSKEWKQLYKTCSLLWACMIVSKSNIDLTLPLAVVAGKTMQYGRPTSQPASPQEKAGLALLKAASKYPYLWVGKNVILEIAKQMTDINIARKELSGQDYRLLCAIYTNIERREVTESVQQALLQSVLQNPRAAWNALKRNRRELPVESRINGGATLVNVCDLVEDYLCAHPQDTGSFSQVVDNSVRWHRDVGAASLAKMEANIENYSDCPYPEPPIKTWSEGKYTFTWVSNHRDLIREGAAMNHCCGGYHRYCLQAQSVIYSMTLRGERMATLEMKEDKLVQVYGPRNMKIDKAASSASALFVKEYAKQAKIFDN